MVAPEQLNFKLLIPLAVFSSFVGISSLLCFAFKKYKFFELLIEVLRRTHTFSVFVIVYVAQQETQIKILSHLCHNNRTQIPYFTHNNRRIKAACKRKIAGNL